jgi:hypothetical protein
MGDITFTAETRFESNMRLELQQKESKLAPKAIQRDTAGAEKTKLDNLISNHQMRKKTARNSDVEHDQTGWDGVWVAKPDPDYLATLVDDEDKLLTKVDIQGGEVMGHSAAVRRAKDGCFISGFFGDMITGKTGTVLNAFPAANIVPVDYQGPGVATAVAGLNVPKIRRARRFLSRNYVDLDQSLYLGLTGQQIEDLTADAKATNADFLNALKPKWSEDGKYLLGLAGFEFIEIELGNPLLYADGVDLTLTTDGNAYRKLPFWSADGMVMATWEELFTSVDKLPTKHFSAQVYSRCQQVASRTDNNRCGYILCDE